MPNFSCNIRLFCDLSFFHSFIFDYFTKSMIYLVHIIVLLYIKPHIIVKPRLRTEPLISTRYMKSIRRYVPIIHQTNNIEDRRQRTNILFAAGSYDTVYCLERLTMIMRFLKQNRPTRPFYSGHKGSQVINWSQEKKYLIN